jgi:hypothetical protein
MPGHDACLPECLDQRSPKASLAGGEPVAAPAHYHRAGHHVPPRVCWRQRAVRIHHYPHIPQVSACLLAGSVATILCRSLIVCPALARDARKLESSGSMSLHEWPVLSAHVLEVVPCSGQIGFMICSKKAADGSALDTRVSRQPPPQRGDYPPLRCVNPAAVFIAALHCSIMQ